MAGTSLGTAYVQIVPSADGIKGSITEVLDGESTAAGKSSGAKIASFAKKAFAAAAVGKFVKDSLAEGGKLQQSYMGGLETIYNGAENKIRGFAREAAKFGISMNDYSEQAVSFGAALKSAFGGDTTKSAKAANDAIIAMADNSAKMGTDIQSIQNAYQGFAKQNYTMLDNLKLGYGGTKEEMQRLLKDAEEFSGIHYDINNLGDVYSAISAIQDKLGISGTAAEEAGQTLTGSMAAVKAYYQNFIGSLAIGEDIQEPLNGLVKAISNFAFNNLIPLIGNIIKALPGAIMTFIRQGIPMLFTNLVTLAGQAADSISAFASNITAAKVKAWATKTGPKMLAAAGKILKSFINGMDANMFKIMAAIAKIGAAIVKGLGSAIWGKVKAAANGIKERFLGPINTLKDKIKGIVDRIKGFFSFHVSAPHIPLPHFSISPKGWKLSDLLKGSIPSLSINWNAEGGIFAKPAVLQGVGEAGPEAVMPLDKFWVKMDNIASAIQRNEGGGTLQLIINLDGKTIGQSTVDYINDQTIMFGTSPVAI